MSFFASQRWRRGILLFVGIFIFAVVVQFGIGWYHRQAAVRSELTNWANEVAGELTYSNRWNLTRLRQADLQGSYCVIDAKGLALDIEGFLPQIDIRVILTDWGPGLQTINVPQTGESWRLLMRRIRGGMLLLGVSPPEDITRLDERLMENAKLFGDSLEDALRIRTHDIDRNIDYAVMDDAGRIRFAIGGIPLKVVSPPSAVITKFTEISSNIGPSCGISTVAFRDKSGRTVGTISAFDELPPEPWRLWRTWVINLLSSCFLALVGTFIGLPWIPVEIRPEILLRNALKTGESATVEFKEALRWDQWQERQSITGRAEGQKKSSETKGISEGVAVKTVAAFLNNRVGGTLVIGIADDKRIVGLERDYASLVKQGEQRGTCDKDRDLFQLHLRNLLAARLGRDITNLHVEIAILNVGEVDVCVVHARPAPSAVYVADGKAKTFYVRGGASTVSLDVEETVTYVEKRWPKALWRRLWNAYSAGEG